MRRPTIPRWGPALLAPALFLFLSTAQEPMQSDNDGRIDYIEFATSDFQASKAFFIAAFGWTFTDWGEDYTAFEDGRLAGGIRPGTPGSSPTVILYAVDLDGMRAKVEAAGGRVTAEHSFPGGRRFHFIEPGGNELAVWSEK